MKKNSKFLKRFGGHEGACGFTLNSEDVLNEFKGSLNKIADKVLSEKDLIKEVSIDAELSFNEITID